MNETWGRTVTRPKNCFWRTRLIGTLLVVMMMSVLAAGQAQGAAPHGIPGEAYFKAPEDGSIVTGIQTVMVWAPEYSLFYAEFGVDGGRWQPLQDQGGGAFAAKWNSGQFPNGKHTLTARFSLGPGKVPVYAVSIRVNVQNIEELSLD